MKKKQRIIKLMIVAFILSFICSCKKSDNDSNTVKDIDGNVYHTVTIGTQVWMVENLKTTKYNDGTEILNITDQEWSMLTTGVYCNYNDDEGLVSIYGRLYNWNAVNTGKLAPKGWHIPTDAEWTILSNYLGGDSIASGKLKEESTTHWFNPNTEATNESGFTALPGGDRYNDSYTKIGEYGFWWSSTSYSSVNAIGRYLVHNEKYVGVNHVPIYLGFSVRCIKD